MGINFNLGSIEGYVSNHLRLFILSVAALVIVVGIAALSVFFIAVRGAEQVMVPDIRGKELTAALLELQVKELYPRLQLRYSQTSADRGLILEQEPSPGTIVKAGRRIRIVVSQGVLINKIDNFIGRNIDEVKMDLQTVYNSSGSSPLVSLKEPLMYEYSSENPGTILAQKPEAGTDISGPVVIELIVSRGRENATVTVPQLTGLGITRALEVIADSGINFRFLEREKRGDEKGETIVYQRPPAETVTPENSPVELTITQPDNLSENEIFGIFHYTVPPNPYPLEVRLEALLLTGERIRLLTVNYSGGEFTVPYRLPAGSVLVLAMLNREIYRETIQ
ncbi:MAG: PASTA domain-containing protein [Treponema sp.]|nr:PASTA domain-containing protein [Treponema sp.]MCL2271296.1 PASTA domain-containing protein [Treponema sp.]